MGRNIDLDEMIEEKQSNCIKCNYNNKIAFEEFDIDCYQFKDGVCEYEFDCCNCEFTNRVYIEVYIHRK
jgi:hypothetical protein